MSIFVRLECVWKRCVAFDLCRNRFFMRFVENAKECFHTEWSGLGGWCQTLPLRSFSSNKRRRTVLMLVGSFFFHTTNHIIILCDRKLTGENWWGMTLFSRTTLWLSVFRHFTIWLPYCSRTLMQLMTLMRSISILSCHMCRRHWFGCHRSIVANWYACMSR